MKDGKQPNPNTVHTLVQEEQKILDNLIVQMDEAMSRIDGSITASKYAKQKAIGLPDAYGMLVIEEHNMNVLKADRARLQSARDSLYNRRIVVDTQDEEGSEEVELKIGLHTYGDGAKIFIVSWKRDICRHFMLDNASKTFRSEVYSHGQKIVTLHTLKLRREIDLASDKVNRVLQTFPAYDEKTEQIVFDEFLNGLLERRSETDFRNIVFSIQKHQGEIIQEPFHQNMIVQGCAGSGKSMIMLHRLPILLYDNPDDLNNTNLYVITPSTTYVQMATQMMAELEIQDLKMGTLDDYFISLIKKYGNPSEIESPKWASISTISDEFRSYIYSQNCATDILSMMEEKRKQHSVDFSAACNHYGVSFKGGGSYETISERIAREIAMLQNILSKETERYKDYQNGLRSAGNSLRVFIRLLQSRKTRVEQEVAKKIEREKAIQKREEEKAKKVQEELERLQGTTDQTIEGKRIAESSKRKIIRNSEQLIQNADKRISKLKERQKEIQLNQPYFDILADCAASIEEPLRPFLDIQSNDYFQDQERILLALDYVDTVCAKFDAAARLLNYIGDPFTDHVSSLANEIDKARRAVSNIRSMDKRHLDRDYISELRKREQYLQILSKEMVKTVYSEILSNSQRKKSKSTIKLADSIGIPFLYLQIQYLFSGAPKAPPETLITIDEAQNLDPLELRLIKDVNGSTVVFNLFGDVQQHIAGSKGVDSWNAFDKIVEFKTHEMNENYRNARQITEYCNLKFGMDMLPINLNGSGVHEISTLAALFEELDSTLSNPMKPGTSCIIVKDHGEAQKLLSRLHPHENTINDMTSSTATLQFNKWNVLTVTQAKGLEFGTAFVISGSMNDNEKYIAYTRALDELYVCELLVC